MGTRFTTLDPHAAAGAALLRGFLADADVFYANRRPGYLDRIGLGLQEDCAVRPGLVHASASLNGPTGPWPTGSVSTRRRAAWSG